MQILFEPGAGEEPVLHTGDCRFQERMKQEAPLQVNLQLPSVPEADDSAVNDGYVLKILQAVRGQARLILDATYANSAYDFPPQVPALDKVTRHLLIDN